MSYDNLGDRQKGYESVPRTQLIRRMPVMIRLDGKAFHTFTKGMPRPYYRPFHKCMWAAATSLCENIQGCQVAYIQSDEITLLLTDYATLDTQAWFDYQVQKMASVAASMCTAAFNQALNTSGVLETLNMAVRLAIFDARVWNLPKEEVVNAFIWRQNDATRNAIQMLGQSKFSHTQMHGLSNDQVQEKLFQEHGINFNNMPVPQKRGVCVVKDTYTIDLEELGLTTLDGKKTMVRSRWVVDENIPIFKEDRNYIGKFI